ncbi:exosortase N [Mucilaginibacter sp. AW1-3]
MKANISLSYIKPISVSMVNVLLAAYGCIAFWLFKGYFSWDVNVSLGLATAPYICTVNKGTLSLKYLVPTILAMVLAILLPVRSMLFVAILLAVLLLVENGIGKLSNVVLFLMLLISPMFKYAAMIFELPVRLWLSAQVAALLSRIGIVAVAAGNQIVLNGSEFSVDPACAGLNMLVTSLLICLFTIAFYQRQTQKRLHFLFLGGLLIITIGLNIVCNFFRITFLVLFKVMPQTFFHDFIGMFCLLLYVIVPLMYGCKLIFGFIAQSKPPKQQPAMVQNTIRYPLLHASFLVLTIFIAFHLSAMQNSMNTKNVDIDLPGYHKNKLADGVLKFENAEALVYLKPTAYYAPGHDPMVCWTGSGYAFTNISRSAINGTLVYTGTLKKGADKIYAAWWFDNGTLQTSDQLKWRWAAAQGQPQFYLVNVNAATPQLLKSKATQLLSANKYLTGNSYHAHSTDQQQVNPPN